jgi:hypothetical protein
MRPLLASWSKKGSSSTKLANSTGIVCSPSPPGQPETQIQRLGADPGSTFPFAVTNVVNFRTH